MATITIPDSNKTLTTFEEISRFLNARGVHYDRWHASRELEASATQEEILTAYEEVLKPYMTANGYETADVVNIHGEIENYTDIRAKFLAEHTHSEDEVRFFADGQGLFWFNLDDYPVFSVLCQKGDLISVPKNTKHWFDAGATDPYVKAIRIFTDQAGWVPHYTESGIEQDYL